MNSSHAVSMPQSQRAAKALLIVAGVMLAAFGVLYLVLPEQMSAQAGIELTGAAALTEIRAYYGGLEIGLGLFLIACGVNDAFRQAGVMALVSCFAAVAVVRAAGMLFYGLNDPFHMVALILESIFVVLGVVVWRNVQSA